MAPNIALDAVDGFQTGSVVVDPMVGSGTVAIAAVAAGHSFYGFDKDPLATLIAKVSTTPLDYEKVKELAYSILSKARQENTSPQDLYWIRPGDETDKFIEFWFAEKQRSSLAGLALHLATLSQTSACAEIDALKVALSRIIVTKESKASLARDTSHSRPHKVAESSDYDVFKGFERSVLELIKRHSKLSILGQATIEHGDARNMCALPNSSCDAIVSSPPYLNAIDYLRGHKLSLVWLGYAIPEIRRLRSDSVGAERATKEKTDEVAEIISGFGDISSLAPRQRSMIARYALDLRKTADEAARIIKPEGTAVYVMGNSCLKGVYIDNATALVKATSLSGFELLDRSEREIPAANRYLPTPANNNPLAGRMRKEIIVTFKRLQPL
ncbi:hypothetical protein [uncultured Ruegeria sp.]|uniref:hypothetical protein n=1 Tax=uncultured Ruegeria sp. TaxID=259304 RepID=UPI0026330231|nr:hypothetical protein [uncultured Ruegeria sp.]